MKSYPYFYPEAALLAIAAALGSFPFFFGTDYFFAAAVGGLSIFGLYVIQTQERAGRFDSSLKALKGFEGWDSVFGSIGTLNVRYKGTDVHFETCILPEDRHVDVDYCLGFDCRSDAPFIIRRGVGRALTYDGSHESASRIRADVMEFDRKYPLTRISCIGGRARLCVRLRFEKDGGDVGGESSDLGIFMGDYLELAHRMASEFSNKKRQPSKQPARSKRRRKR